MKELNNPDTFYYAIKDIKNILIGNGFCLSNPVLQGAFEWNIEEALRPKAIWDSVLPANSTKNPESDLEIIRKKILEKTLFYYVSKLSEKLSPEKKVEKLYDLFQAYNKKIRLEWECNALFEKREKIFTLNYDPILYFEVLNRLNEKKIVDGFQATGDKTLNPKKIIDCLNSLENKEKIQILYLHGSWFIVINEQYELKKLSFRKDSQCSVDDIYKNNNKPYIVLEDRSLVKEMLLESTAYEHSYLQYCFNQLKKMSGELLIFGCSFEKDEHIVKALAENKNLDKIYITCLNTNDQTKIQGKLGLLKDFKIEYWKVDSNVIWKKTSQN